MSLSLSCRAGACAPSLRELADETQAEEEQQWKAPTKFGAVLPGELT